MLGAADLVAQGSPELGRGGPSGDIGEEPVTAESRSLAALSRLATLRANSVDVVDVDRPGGQRGTEVGHQLDGFGPLEWL